MLVGFIIPFKPASQSNNWHLDNQLLNRTINCILNQTCDEFLIYVICSDEPTQKITNEKVRYVQYPEPFKYYDDIADADRYFHLFKRKLFMARFYDKAKKVTYGCAVAKKDSCNYLMNVDADDLISRNIVQYVRENNGNLKTDGWYIPKGYVWNNGSKIILRQNQMQNFNGSTHVIREDIVWIPDWKSTVWTDYNLFAAHGWIVDRLKSQFGKKLLPIPFRGVIYVAHESNDSGLQRSLTSLNLRSIAKKILRGQFLSRKIRSEFYIIE